MTESIETRRKRLRFRSWHRGTREMDLLLGPFAEAYLDSFSEDEIQGYDALLEMSDPDLYAWISGREAVPVGQDSALIELLRNFNFRATTY